MQTLVSKLNWICPECGGSLAWETKWDAKGTEFSVTRCCGHIHVIRNYDSNFGKGNRSQQRPHKAKGISILAALGWGLLTFAIVPLILLASD